MNRNHRTLFRTIALLPLLAMLAHAGPGRAESDPVVGGSKSTRALEALPRAHGPRKVVTIYEFRSSVTEIPARGATDMFTTALVKSGAFAVAERSRLNEGVKMERELAASGAASGSAAQGKLAGASYIFEGTISEGGVGESQGAGTINIGGMELGGGSSTDSIGIDVRVVDANSGLVIDSVDVHKSIETAQKSVSGVGNLVGALAGLRGRTMPISVDASAQSSRKESVDKAVRACIEVAVLELVSRYGRD